MRYHLFRSYKHILTLFHPLLNEFSLIVSAPTPTKASFQQTTKSPVQPPDYLYNILEGTHSPHPIPSNIRMVCFDTRLCALHQGEPILQRLLVQNVFMHVLVFRRWTVRDFVLRAVADTLLLPLNLGKPGMTRTTTRDLTLVSGHDPSRSVVSLAGIVLWLALYCLYFDYPVGEGCYPPDAFYGISHRTEIGTSTPHGTPTPFAESQAPNLLQSTFVAAQHYPAVLIRLVITVDCSNLRPCRYELQAARRGTFNYSSLV